MHSSALCILFLALVSGNTVKRFEKLMYEDIETAPYQVVKLPGKRPYEKRVYPTLHWVTTKYNYSELEGYFNLRKYIAGDNSESTRINMTTPVVVTWDRADSIPFPFMNDAISFYIPRKFQKNPPIPTNPDVFLEYVPLTLYSWEYPGYPSDLQFHKMRTKLEYELSKDRIQYNTSVVYYACYNAPWEVSGRRNEVWILDAGK